jgi:hypothetical protein
MSVRTRRIAVVLASGVVAAGRGLASPMPPIPARRSSGTTTRQAAPGGSTPADPTPTQLVQGRADFAIKIADALNISQAKAASILEANHPTGAPRSGGTLVRPEDNTNLVARSPGRPASANPRCSPALAR